jgi:hypothetical protein
MRKVALTANASFLGGGAFYDTKTTGERQTTGGNEIALGESTRQASMWR